MSLSHNGLSDWLLNADTILLAPAVKIITARRISLLLNHVATNNYIKIAKSMAMAWLGMNSILDFHWFAS